MKPRPNLYSLEKIEEKEVFDVGKTLKNKNRP